jgi:adenosylcobinamide-GDP ribazoletransferase
VIHRFFGALQFLTVLPVHVSTSPPGGAALFFPVVGALLGAGAGALFLILQRPLDSSTSALFAVAGLVFATGALHEDGLADVADGFRAGRTRERIMEILKDSRIGTYGAVTLFFSITVRWQCLERCRINPVLGLASSLAVSRSALVLTAFLTPHAGEGLGAAFASRLSSRTTIAVLVQMLVFASFSAWRGLAMLLSSALCVLLARHYFVLRLGGANGDCLGAASQIVETLNFVILAWQPSI